MAKAGRPAKPGERYPSGKLKPQTDGLSGTLWHRMKTNAKALNLDPRLTSELGRLNWFGEFTLGQTVAGHKIGAIYGRYERLTGLSRSVRSPSYERSYGASGLDAVDEERLQKTEEGREILLMREQQVVEATQAFHALRDSIDVALRGDIEALCVEDRGINPSRYELVREQLTNLATSWKIKKAEDKQNGGSRGPARAAIVTGKKEPNLDRIFWVQVARALCERSSRPGAFPITEEQLGNAYDLQQTLVARERFRRDKSKKKGKVLEFRKSAPSAEKTGQ